MVSLTDVLSRPAYEAAPRLLGSILEREVNGQLVRVKIVETEAYGQTDAASHSYKGQTERTKIMFGEPGFLYVYFTYGMHYCCNVVTGAAGDGSAVLIRAVEPLSGIETLLVNRPGKQGVELTNGPAKLCQALHIDKQLNGHNLRDSPLKLILGKPLPEADIAVTERIGITMNKQQKWRYYINGNPFVSKP